MLRSVLLLSVLALSACASTQNRHQTAEIHQWTGQGSLSTYAARIVGLDGKLRFDQRAQYSVEPGLRVVLLATSGPTRPQDETQSIYLAAKPCQAYFLAAEHACSRCKDWKPVVQNIRPIPGCVVDAEPAGVAADVGS